PFNGYTKIKYGIPKFGKIELNIYSLQGTKIQTLVNQTLIPGEYEIQWNGRNTMGQRQSSGVYIYSIFSGGKKHTSRKLVLLK
ncbi:MAG: T9SS type A sorting domain-containing protein, partial [Candidatus Neomarinimicrobiota bacterium]|nr:T9SS type A sorting domain-containing protein [Candidatus Neomarinimicrobiota bacterium]